jgi:hypothetical protein
MYLFCTYLVLICVQILNLPEGLRNKPGNMLIYGIISGLNYPISIQAYISILVNDLLCSEHQKIKIYDSFLNDEFEISARLLFSIADNPAHVLINMQQGSNSIQGCHKCGVQGVKDVRTNSVIYQCQGERLFCTNFVLI